MSKKIYKQIYRLVVLTSLPEGSNEFSDVHDIADTIDDGYAVGSLTLKSNKLVPDKQVKKELVNLEEDSSFFDIGPDEYPPFT